MGYVVSILFRTMAQVIPWSINLAIHGLAFPLVTTL